MPGYRVNEIFYSLQGEGFHTGTPAVFVRLSGCNLRCDFCDTDHEHGTHMSIEQIIDEVSHYPCPTVVITGGEPTLHDLRPLVEAINRSGRKAHLETNGTNPVNAPFDWITCSPKKITLPDGTARYAYHESMTRIADELKVVFTSAEGIEPLADSFETPNLFLQPCSGKNIRETVDYILRHPRWRLSLQTHLILGIQ